MNLTTILNLFTSADKNETNALFVLKNLLEYSKSQALSIRSYNDIMKSINVNPNYVSDFSLHNYEKPIKALLRSKEMKAILNESRGDIKKAVKHVVIDKSQSTLKTYFNKG